MIVLACNKMKCLCLRITFANSYNELIMFDYIDNYRN